MRVRLLVLLALGLSVVAMSGCGRFRLVYPEGHPRAASSSSGPGEPAAGPPARDATPTDGQRAASDTVEPRRTEASSVSEPGEPAQARASSVSEAGEPAQARANAASDTAEPAQARASAASDTAEPAQARASAASDTTTEPVRTESTAATPPSEPPRRTRSSGRRTASEGVEPVPASRYADRLRGVEIGQTIEEVHAKLGGAPVRHPRRGRPPIPAPRFVVEFTRVDGAPVRLESYVIYLRRRDGCPDFLFRDIPVTFAAGRVVALDWESIEWEWERWGGDLAALRSAQDRYTCLDPEAAPEG